MKRLIGKTMKSIAFFSKYSWLLFSFVVAAGFVAFILKYAQAIPIADDFDAIFNFILNYDAATNWQEKIQLIFAPHNEHRIALVRLEALMLYKITGQVQLLPMMWIGSLSVLLAIFMLWKTLEEKQICEKWKLILPVLLLILNPQWFELALWAMTTTALSVVATALVSMYFAHRKKIVWALCFSILTTYSNGNGMLVFPLIIAIFLFQKDYWKTIITTACFGIITVLYLHNLTTFGSGAGSGFGVLSNPAGFVEFTFAFLGSALQVPGLTIVAVVLGALICAFGVYLAATKYYLKNPVLFYTLCFLVLTAGVVANGRVETGIAGAFAFRYKIYSVVTLAVVFLIVYDILSERFRIRYYYGALILSAGFCGMSYCFYLPKVQQMYQYYQADVWQYRLTGKAFSSLFPNSHLDEISKRAETKGIYQFPELNMDDVVSHPVLRNLSKKNDENIVQIDTLLQTDSLIFISGKARNRHTDARRQSVYVVFKTDKNEYQIYPTIFQRRGEADENFKGSENVSAGFRAFIRPLEPMEYHSTVIDKK